MKKLALKIINFLKENCTHELPKEGIIAGQSVAEAYFRIMNIPIYTRIKDIDIFVAKNHNKKDKIFRSCERLSYDISFKGTTQELKVTQQQRNNYNDENGRLEFYDMNIPFERVDNIRTTYNIKNVFELENLNIIEIDTTSAKGDTTFLQNTIESFDINCIKIGLCIKSKVLYISKDFSDFLKTKQAQIVSYKSPVKTFTRLVEKKSYYKGVYFDLDYEVNMIYPLIDMGSNDFKKSISKEYYSKLSSSAKKDLSKYFTLKEKEHCFLDKTKIYLNYEKITNSNVIKVINKINKIIKENKYATLIYPKFDYMVPNYNALTKGDLQNKYPILERLKEYISTNGKSIPLAVKNFRKNINLEWKRDYILLISATEFETIYFTPKKRVFNKTVKSNISLFKRDKKIKSLFSTKTYFFTHRSTLELFFSHNKSKLFVELLKKHKDKKKGLVKLTEFMKFFSTLSFNTKNDYMHLFQTKLSNINALIRHSYLISCLNSLAQVKERALDYQDIATKIYFLERLNIEIIGMFEAKTLPYLLFFEDMNNFIRLSEQINIRIEKSKEEDRKIEVLKIDELLLKHSRFKIIQIYNPLRLKEVGKEMKHCVGGYTDRLKNKSMLFFDIYNRLRQRRTLSVRIIKEEDVNNYVTYSLRFDQYKGKCNSLASVRENRLILGFIQQLEKKLLNISFFDEEEDA